MKLHALSWVLIQEQAWSTPSHTWQTCECSLQVLHIKRSTCTHRLTLSSSLWGLNSTHCIDTHIEIHSQAPCKTVSAISSRHFNIISVRMSHVIIVGVHQTTPIWYTWINNSGYNSAVRYPCVVGWSYFIFRAPLAKYWQFKQLKRKWYIHKQTYVYYT